MTSRTTWLFTVALAAVTMMGCPRAETPAPSKETASSKQAQPQNPKRSAGVIGYYVHDDPVFYGAKDMTGVPPGQIMYLGIEKGRWRMRNMLIGYGGTWVEEKGGATLTVNEGPTGKASGTEKITAKRTASGITLTLNGSTTPAMRFTFVAVNAPKDFGYDEFLGTKK